MKICKIMKGNQLPPFLATMNSHTYIINTIILTVYSQLIMRWQANFLPSLGDDRLENIATVISFLFRPWVVTSIFATLLAGISWMLALTKFEISYAYAFISLNYLFITIFGILFFNESISAYKILGITLIIIGIIVTSKS